ncbi:MULTISPECIES: RNA polymerase sigma factor [Streptosporangium]|uniref:RNA polymerase sigma factor (Sigma-70 family) n=1 Tax=Streptosporangium brasiliense TaxID=47480 RepID=A0ABT9R9D4_9ACTN|nr:sigma-70 family RNA polymerase sigma factor [Streptosporangium brasiliense]MDP9865856.1 RNA polymerase sigma factor (sigma-70 family) [Streptosporangium brasiliense]
MPGWPAVGRTDDQRLVGALRRADTTAPAKLYDSYAERLNDYAHSLLGERAGAADAVHDALVTACGRVERLREPGRLRPWLYALVRTRCAAGARGPAPTPVLDDHDTPDDPELAALVHEALAELSGQEREVLELSLRHDLSAGEVGTVLGLTSRQAAARLGRAREHLENSAAAVVLARVGRAHCPDLSAMVDSWEGPLTTMLRRRLSGHIGRCEVCLERRDRHVSAGRLLDMVPVAFPPLSLRRRVVETCVNPDLAGVRASVVEAGDRFDRAGFPVAAERRAKSSRRPRARRAGAGRAREEGTRPLPALDTPDRPRTVTGRRGTAPDTRDHRQAAEPRRRAPARRTPPLVAAAACVLAAAVVMIVTTGQDLTGGPAQRAEAAPERGPALITLEPGPAPGPAEPSPVDPASLPEPTPAPGRTAEAVKTRTPPPMPTPGPARRAATRRPVPDRPRATRTPAPPPPAGRLAVSCPTDIGEGAGQIRLSAREAPISWSATTSGGLDVHPRQGRLKAGARAVIWVTAADPAEGGTGRVAFKAAGGGSSCAISWEGPGPEESDPPGDPAPLPTPAPTPSTAPSAEPEKT